MASLHCFSCGKLLPDSSSFFSAEKNRKALQLEQRNSSVTARLWSSHGHERALEKNNNTTNNCRFPLSFHKTRNPTLPAPLYVSRQLRFSIFFQRYSVSQVPSCYRRINVIKKALVSEKIISSQRSSELGDRIVSVSQPYKGHSNLPSTYDGNDDDDDPWHSQKVISTRGSDDGGTWQSQKATSTRGSNDDDIWQSLEEAHQVEALESRYPLSDSYGQGPGKASSLEKREPKTTDESSSENNPVLGIKEDWRMAGLSMRKAATRVKARSTNIADGEALDESALARVTPSGISNRWNGIMLLNFLAALYGSNAVAMKFTEAAAVSPPASLACSIKFGAAALAFSPALVETFNRRLSKEDKGMILAGLELALWLMAGIITQTVGLGGASASSNASLLLVFTVVLVPVLEIFTGRRRISKLTWLATLAALSGMFFLKESGQWDLDLVLPKVEDLMGILSGAFFGIQIFRAEMLCSRFDPLKLTAVQLVFMFLVSVAWEGWTLGSLEQFQQLEGILPQLPWGPLLYSGLLAGGVGAWVELNGLRNVHASTATLIYTTIPVWGGFMTSLVTGKGGLPSLQEVLAGSAFLVGASVFALVTAPEPKGQIKEEDKLVEKDDQDRQSEAVVKQAPESLHLPVSSMERKVSDAGVPLWGTRSGNVTVNAHATVAGERLQGEVKEEKLSSFSGTGLNLSYVDELVVEERRSFTVHEQHEGAYTNHQKLSQNDGQLNEMQEDEDEKQEEDEKKEEEEKKEDGPNPDTLPSAFLQTQLKFPFYATQAQEFLAKARGVGESINTGLASAKAGGASVGAGAKVAGSTAAAAGSSGQAVAGQVAAGQVAAGQAVAGQVAAGQAVAGQVAAGQAVAGQVAAGQAVAGQVAAGVGGIAAPAVGGAATGAASGVVSGAATAGAGAGGAAVAGGTAAAGAGGAATAGGAAAVGGGAIGSTVGTAAASGAAIGGASAGGVAASGTGAGVGAGLVGAGGAGAGVGGAAGGAAHIAATAASSSGAVAASGAGVGAGVGGGAAATVGAVTSSAGSLVTGVAGTLNVAGEVVLGSVQAVGGGALQATSGAVQGLTAPVSQTVGAALQTAATVAPGPTAAVASAVSSATTAVSSASTAVSSVTSTAGAALQTAVTVSGNAIPHASAVANATGAAISAVAPVASTAAIGLQSSVASISPAASGALQAVSTVIAAEPSIPAAVSAFQSASSLIPSNVVSAAGNILPGMVGGGGGGATAASVSGAVQAITSVAVAAGAGAGAVVGSGVGNVNVSSTLQKVASGVGAVGAEASSVANSVCQATVPAIESLMNAVKPAASFSADRVSKAIEALPPSAAEVMSLLSQRARNVADVLTPVSNMEVLNNTSLSSQQLVMLERTAICPLELGFLPAVDGGSMANQIAVDIEKFGASAVDYIGAACFAAAPLDVHEPPPSEMEAYFERVSSFLLSMQELSGTAVEETDRRADAVTSVVMQVQPVLDSLLQSQPWLKHFNTGGQCRLDAVDFMQSDFAQSVVVQSQPLIEHLSHAVTSHGETLALLHFLQTFF